MEPTPVMRQYRELKARHPDAILLFQLGDFYEAFFEDAEVAARDLEIVLTSRDGVPMAGVPVRKADLYVQRLLRKGHKVALASQLDRPGKGKKLLTRGIVRVLTPGTVIEEGALDPGLDVLLAAVWPHGETVGVAWAEAASGGFWADELPLAELGHLAARLQVAEWVFPEGWSLPPDLPGVTTPRPAHDFRADLLGERFPGALRTAPLAACAAGALLAYLRATVGDLAHLRPPAPPGGGETLVLDAFTQRSLELLAPLRPEGTVTLFSVLDRTKTAMGRRLLRRWILAPLARREAIEARLDAVEAILGSDREELGRALGQCCDLPRLLGRAATGSLSPLDLLALARTIEATGEASRILNDPPSPLPARLAALAQAIGEAPQELACELRSAIVDPPPPTLDEGGVIRTSYDPTLDALRGEAEEVRERLAALEAEERQRTGIPTLKVGYNRVFGYYFEVTRAHVGKVPSDWRRRQSLVGAERFTSDALASFADRLATAEEGAKKIERQLFSSLGQRVGEATEALAAVGEALAELDALWALAEVARRRNYSRPRFVDRPVIHIVEGRHPMVEEVTQFVPNDLHLEEGVNLAVVTGPNMAGKSVFLRQTALIALLAQMGSFVPAREAELPLFDRIYARVGASDALTGGLSTFMAEMAEAAEILNGATPRSLVILDELGRGTSTHDGMALARAIARHLTERVGCKTLFATHYRELARLADEARGVANLHAAAREWKGEVVFLYRILPGVAERSYGVHVARLARLPEEVLRDAQRTLDAVERGAAASPPSPGEQLPLFSAEDHPVLQELRSVDPDRLTPLEALHLLHRLKEALGRG
ncbi:MAG TPA: DNA mismatch repair protein MutS [Candidatus Acetothermia bacterium]|nr:DNA mismatch repair protein MutS [Candidatus Acetothermia bacterium]